MTALAISLAIAFWTPYATEPICPQGVHVIQVTPAKSYAYPGGKKTLMPHDALGMSGMGAKSCYIWLSKYVKDTESKFRVIAHEIGHDWFGLDHSQDKTNIMYPYMTVM